MTTARTIYPSVVSFRLSRTDKKKIVQHCNLQGLTLSEYFRKINAEILNNKKNQ